MDTLVRVLGFGPDIPLDRVRHSHDGEAIPGRSLNTKEESGAYIPEDPATALVDELPLLIVPAVEFVADDCKVSWRRMQ